MLNRHDGARTRTFLIALLLLASLPATAATLSESIDALLAAPELKHGIQGVVIESLRDGRVLYERNRNLVFVPASNIKLIVSATALDRLGPDFTYETPIYVDGLVMNDVISGNLIISGRGDPTLTTADLKAMVAVLKSKGVRAISGRVMSDDSHFDNARLGRAWNWDDEPYYYSAQISALNLNENVVAVYVSPGQSAGAKPRVRLEPATDYMTISNEATTGAAKSEKTLSVDRLRAKNVIRITGSIPLDHVSSEPEEPITVEDPALFTATVLREMLIESGIPVTGQAAAGRASPDAVVVASHTSPPLKEIIARLNKPSNNLFAEVLLKTLGAEIRGSGTVEAGREVEVEFLARAGADTSAMAIVDASGLSRMNYISPGNTARLLRFMHSHEQAKVYIDSLPIAGVDGTLRRRMKGTAAESNVRAKTGYVSRVSSLSGYVTTKGGEPLVFSILMNNHLCRNSEATAIQNRICNLLAGLD